MLRMKQEAELAESRVHIEELEKLRLSSSGERNINKTESMTASKRARDALSILKEENEEESSGSIMPPDADSEIPSEMYMSEDMKDKHRELKKSTN
jgi:hypothetical protein